MNRFDRFGSLHRPGYPQDPCWSNSSEQRSLENLSDEEREYLPKSLLTVYPRHQKNKISKPRRKSRSKSSQSSNRRKQPSCQVGLSPQEKTRRKKMLAEAQSEVDRRYNLLKQSAKSSNEFDLLEMARRNEIKELHKKKIA